MILNKIYNILKPYYDKEEIINEWLTTACHFINRIQLPVSERQVLIEFNNKTSSDEFRTYWNQCGHQHFTEWFVKKFDPTELD